MALEIQLPSRPEDESVGIICAWLSVETLGTTLCLLEQTRISGVPVTLGSDSDHYSHSDR